MKKIKGEGYFPAKDNIVGWGVVRMAPWHLAGIFETRAQAEDRRRELGADDYRVGWGRGAIGTDDFIFEDEPDA